MGDGSAQGIARAGADVKGGWLGRGDWFVRLRWMGAEYEPAQSRSHEMGPVYNSSQRQQASQTSSPPPPTAARSNCLAESNQA